MDKEKELLGIKLNEIITNLEDNDNVLAILLNEYDNILEYTVLLQNMDRNTRVLLNMAGKSLTKLKLDKKIVVFNTNEIKNFKGYHLSFNNYSKLSKVLESNIVMDKTGYITELIGKNIRGR